MKPVTVLMLLLASAMLTGCIGLKSGGEGVFEPTTMQPPPSERGGGAAPVSTPSGRAAERRGLSIPNR